MESLRQTFDNYIQTESFFQKSLKPFRPSEDAPEEALEKWKARQVAIEQGNMRAYAEKMAVHDHPAETDKNFFKKKEEPNKKIEPDHQSPTFIQTIREIGYKFKS